MHETNTATRCHCHGLGTVAIDDDARVHRVRVRGHPGGDSGVGGDVKVVVVDVDAAADAEAVVVEGVEHAELASSADEQIRRRAEAAEAGRLGEGEPWPGRRERRGFASRHRRGQRRSTSARCIVSCF